MAQRLGVDPAAGLAAAVVSFVIGEVTTGGVLLLLTVFNAIVGPRQDGKAPARRSEHSAEAPRTSGESAGATAS